jgi:hypothetical protein
VAGSRGSCGVLGEIGYGRGGDMVESPMEGKAGKYRLSQAKCMEKVGHTKTARIWRVPAGDWGASCE